MITQQLTQPPDPPQRSDPATFATKADSFVSWLAAFANELSVWTDQANETAEDVNNLRDETKRYRDQTEACKDEALAAINAIVYDPDATYNYPDTVIGEDGHTYRCLGTNVTGDNPVGSTTGNWKRITAELPVDLYLETFGVSVTYDSAGDITEVDYTNGFKAIFTYNANKFISKVEYQSSDGTVLLTVSFTYDTSGKLISVTRS